MEKALPALLPAIQVQLLDLLSLVIARRPHRDGLPAAQLHALSQALLVGAPQRLPELAWYSTGLRPALLQRPLQALLQLPQCWPAQVPDALKDSYK